MRILVACEFSGVVRRAFRERGDEAWSCDVLDSEDGGEHYKCDVREVIGEGWDIMIGHPPCTRLCSSGARWWKGKEEEQDAGIKFFLYLWNAPIEKICIENPIGIMSRILRKPDQVIQPWQYGHGEVKGTCLWLKGLNRLRATNVVDGREARCHRASPGIDRWKERSRTYEGIAKAMAEQWGSKSG